jgi:hypothetical protein
MASAFRNQLQNRNFLSASGFSFSLTKYPKVSFFSNSARIPEITLGTAIQPSYLKDLDVPGDKVTYGDFYLRFIVDENMENYMSIHNWITSLGYPESTDQFEDLVKNVDGTYDFKNQYSDGTLRVLNSNYKPTIFVNFKDLFPVSLAALEFESTNDDVQYFTVEAVFKYTIYSIVDSFGNSL